jgi:hypothetical protein
MKNLMIYLINDAQDLCNESHKTLLGERKDLNRWRDTQYSWVRRLSVVISSPKLISRFNTSPNQNPGNFNSK